jgi:transposase-like protein
MNKRHSEQFKQEAVRHVHQHPEQGVAAIAKQLGVGYSTLDSWLRKHRQTLTHSQVQNLSSEQQRIRQLERENAHLREVNEIIKKAHVYFINHPSR